MESRINIVFNAVMKVNLMADLERILRITIVMIAELLFQLGK